MSQSHDVEAHAPDERLKQAIGQTQAALATLTEIADGGDVEAHKWHGSDERLKQAIEQTQAALATLTELTDGGESRPPTEGTSRPTSGIAPTSASSRMSSRPRARSPRSPPSRGSAGEARRR